METTVSQMSVDELRKLISEVVSDVVEEKLAQYADPDAGLEIRDEVRELLLRQDEEMMQGVCGVGLDEILADLGIGRTEIETQEDNVPVTVS